MFNVLSFLFLLSFNWAQNYFQLEPSWIFQTPHQNWINWVDISNDGKYVSAGTYKPNTKSDFNYYLINSDGEIIFEESFPQYQNGIFAISLSENAQISAIGGTKKLNTGEGFDVGFIKAYNHHQNHDVILDLQTEGRVLWIQQSSDSKTLVAASRNLYFFKLKNGRYENIKTIKGNKPNRALSLSRDGKYAISGNSVGEFRVFKIDENQIIEIFKKKMEKMQVKQESIQATSMNADGTFFAFSGNDGKVETFSRNESTDEIIPQWTYHSPIGTNIYALSISEDAQFVAIGSSKFQGENPGEKTLEILTNNCTFSTCSSSLYFNFEPDRAPNPGLKFDSKNKFLVLATGYPVGTPSSFYLLDLPNKKILSRFITKDMNWPLTISRDGNAIFGGSDSGELFYFKNVFNN